jgi:hypothetical protein
MTIRTFLITTIVALIPALGLAQGCHGDRADQQAMSCAEGTAWDEATGTCVPQISS